MDSILALAGQNGGIFSAPWSPWHVVGWLGNAVFFTRFAVQWYATERRKQVVIPTAFWWLSLLGAGLLFSYALFYRRDPVFIFAYAFTWIPYARNLLIHARHRAAFQACPACGLASPPRACYCASCGTQLQPARPAD